MAGVNIVRVNYKGVAPAMTALIAGEIQLIFPTIAGAVPHIKSGRLRALGVTGPRRSPEMPEVPTISEAGVKDYVMVAWFGLAGPKALPREIQMKLHGEAVRAAKSPDVQKGLAGAGQEVAWQDTPERFFEFMKAEGTKWARAVRDSGAQVQ